MANKKAPTKKAPAKKAPKKSAKKYVSPKRGLLTGGLRRELTPLKLGKPVLVLDAALRLDTTSTGTPATLSQPVSDVFVLTKSHHLFTIGDGQPTTLGISSTVIPDVGADPLSVTAKVEKTTVD